MSNLVKSDVKNLAASSTQESTGNDLLIDEFEIVELEDRLELAGRCNRRCSDTAVAV